MDKAIKDMTNDELFDFFNSFDDYCLFDQVEMKLASRPDVHAMILLDRLFPSSQDQVPEMALIDRVGMSQMWINIPTERFKAVVDHKLIRELVCCGVGYDLDRDRLSIIVAGEI